MENIFLILLVVSGLAFVVQTVFAFIGFDDIDMSLGDDTVGFFTIRNMIAFLLGFSSAGYLLVRNGYGQLFTTVVGVGFGLLLSGTVMFSMKLMKKLQQENKIEHSDYRGLMATVVIKVVAKRGRVGKVEFSLNGRVDEMPAVTDEEEDLVKGAQVQIVRRLDNNNLLVIKSLNIW